MLNSQIPVATLSADSDLTARQLSFVTPEDLDQARDLGLFYLKSPDCLDLESARQFGRELIATGGPYLQVPEFGELEGFIALKNNQQTKLALRREQWVQHYPEHIVAFGRQLDAIGIAIIRAVFRQSGIPDALWDRASEGYASGGGNAFLNFAYYDTRTPDWGLRPHTDYGFVTILDASAPGLQIENSGQFEDVPVLPGHLIINFGEALNFITAHSDRAVSAVTHPVLSQRSSDPIRHGIVYFANPDLEGTLSQFDAAGEARGSSSVKSLFAQLETRLTENR